MAGDESRAQTPGEVVEALRGFQRSIERIASMQIETLSRIDRADAHGRELGERVTVLARDVRELKRAVHGSDPPPGYPLTDAVEGAQAKASSASLEAAALEGRMLAALASVDHKIEAVARQNAEQSRAQGIGLHGFAYLLSRDGLKQISATTAAVAAIVAAVASSGTCQAVHLADPPRSVQGVAP
jgi:hypothetical protein